MGIFLGVCFICGAVGAGISWCIVALVAQDSSFSDHWLDAACVLPIIGVIFGAKITEWAWPSPRLRGLTLWLMLVLFGGLSSYIGFAIVSRIWNPDPSVSLPTALLNPSKIRDITFTRRDRNNPWKRNETTRGPVYYLVLGAIGGGGLVPLFFSRSLFPSAESQPAPAPPFPTRKG